MEVLELNGDFVGASMAIADLMHLLEYKKGTIPIPTMCCHVLHSFPSRLRKWGGGSIAILEIWPLEDVAMIKTVD